jgi:predicted nuclease of predicted toxin-antitoxin system
VRWLADECVDAALVAHLRAAGHDVVYVAERTSGMTDAEAIAQAHAEQRILLTEDKDFGELVVRWRRPIPGLVLLRIDSERRGLKWSRIDAAIQKIGEGLLGHYTVIDEVRFRVRSLAGPS